MHLIRSLLPMVLLAALPPARAEPIAQETPPLRVCADPGNLPLSNRAGEGFQNKIAEILAEGVGRRLEYYWYSYYGVGLTRNTLNADKCDVLMDVPSNFEMALVTRPYYRSTFVLTYRDDKKHVVKSLDDPLLKRWKIGVLQSSPARKALRVHDVMDNTEVHYSFADTGADSQNRPGIQVEQVVDGSLDAAETWGPIAGYYRAKRGAPLAIVPLNTMDDSVPLEFSISFGVRRGDRDLKDALDKAFETKRDAIRRVLADYGVPLVACDDCVISGDVPSHGSYAKIEQANVAARGDHPESSKAELAATRTRVAAGADPTKELAHAVLGNDPDRVRWLLEHGAKADDVAELEYTALQWAVREGHVEVARILLDKGAGIDVRDKDGWTPLMFAVWKQNPDMVALLLSRHANPNSYAGDGWSALTIAISYGGSADVQRIVDAGADVNASNDVGYTPLMLATAKSADGVPALLIARGANVSAANKAGITPLMLAAAADDDSAVKRLLDAGAKADAKDGKGQSALDIARQRRNDRVATLLSTRS